MQWLQQQLARIRDLNDDPRKIALGIGIGTFVGFFPPLGIKTLLAMGAARLCKGNVVAAAIAVTLHDLLLPIAPFLLAWEFKAGSHLLGRPPAAGIPGGFHHGDLAGWLHAASLVRLETPLLLGGAVVGAPAGIAAYYVARRFLRTTGRPR
ncbi:DUF2062 domain-containing protein [Luteolibacter marinus]|uniref:DUF2062 domain-containing protein n=1 Tax=Luteolibacter marinus TaxID=2776705 RepID=UPI0018680C1F|nr:DUF2062 domain-containing protein [Luteolibacter marinus]